MGRLAVEAKFAWQRMTRGWDDRAVWNVDRDLAEHVADLLEELALTTTSWPDTDEFPEPADWIYALQDNAAKLRRMGSNGANPEGVEAMRWVADHLPHLWD